MDFAKIYSITYIRKYVSKKAIKTTLNKKA